MTERGYFVTDITEDAMDNYFTLSTQVLSTNRTATNSLNATSAASLTASAELASPPVLRVVYSELERGLFELYLALSMAISTLLNSLVLIAILKDSRLYKPENVIIAADAINNLLGVVATQPYMVWALSVDYPHSSALLCQIHGDFSVAQFSLTAYILCVYAFERTYFLCNPMDYSRHVTNLRVAVVLFFMYVFSVVVSHFSAYQGRIFLATMASCQSKTTTMNTAMVFCVFALPAVLMVIYSVRKIKGLESRSVRGTNPTAATNAAETVKKEKQRARQVSTSKTILLVSGAFFMTLLPMGTIRLVILATGISIVDLETRNCNHAWPILFRIGNLMMVTTVNYINPTLYLTMRRNLKASLGIRPNRSCCLLFGSRRRTQVHPIDDLPSITIGGNAK